jgi:hypothetical protein
VCLLKTRAFVGSVNNGYVRLLIGEKEEERMDVKVVLLTEYLQEPFKEKDIGIKTDNIFPTIGLPFCL